MIGMSSLLLSTDLDATLLAARAQQDELELTCRIDPALPAADSSTTDLKSKVTLSTSSLPASILEKSRMSSMTVRSASAEELTVSA